MPHWFVAPPAELTEAELISFKQQLTTDYENITLSERRTVRASFVVDISGTEKEIQTTVKEVQTALGCRIYQGEQTLGAPIPKINIPEQGTDNGDDDPNL